MIAFPPCTYISYAAMKYWNQPGRSLLRVKALELFATLWEAPINKICIENPVGCADMVIKKPDQIIHPYYFGESEQKRTCLWLKNLPKLIHIKDDDFFEKSTHVLKPDPIYIDKSGKKRYFTDAISGTKCKGKANDRSRTFLSIARAMAEQWG